MLAVPLYLYLLVEFQRTRRCVPNPWRKSPILGLGQEEQADDKGAHGLWHGHLVQAPCLSCKPELPAKTA